MPRHVDMGSREREIQAATLRIIARSGVNGVTIRRVAGELGASTSVITHFTRDKDELLARAVAGALEDFRCEVTALISTAEDPLWAVIDWSLDADTSGVWPALVLATATDVSPTVSSLVRVFDSWWTDTIGQLVAVRLIDGLSQNDAADAIGVVADGLTLARDTASWSAQHRRFIARILIEPLLAH